MPTNLDFDIDHLALVGMRRDTIVKNFLFLRTTFPNLQYIRRSIPDLPRKAPKESVVLMRRTLDPTHNLRPVRLYKDRLYCTVLERVFSEGHMGDLSYADDIIAEWLLA